MSCNWPNCVCLPKEQCEELKCEGCLKELPLHQGLHHDHWQPVMRCENVVHMEDTQ